MIAADDLQLKFELDLDEVEEDASQREISNMEARQICEAARQAFDKMRLEGREEVGKGWFDDYLKLIEQGWPWRVACYIAWASSPKINRWPKSIKGLAEEVLGLNSPRVIFAWREKYPAINTIVSLMQAAPLWDHRRDVIEALVTMASEKDYKSFNDRKLFLELIGDYVPKSKIELGKAGKGDISDKSDEELRKWVVSGEGTASSSKKKIASTLTGSRNDTDDNNDINEEEDDAG